MVAAASDPALTEDLALVLLKQSDLPTQALDRLSRNRSVMKSRKVRLALVEHPRTPRHISVPMVRHLFTFDLMRVALTPVVPADIKMSAEESLINRLERLSQGERLSLGHRASGRVAAVLLLDPEPRVIHAALENSRLTESAVIKALMRRGRRRHWSGRSATIPSGRRGGKSELPSCAMKRRRWAGRWNSRGRSRLLWCARSSADRIFPRRTKRGALLRTLAERKR